MSPHGIPQVIHVSQYDSDFSIQFKLYASVGTLNIESGTTAEIRGTKGSGTGYSASATLNTSNGTVTVAGSEQMTAVAGRNIFEIVLKKSGKVLGSANFVLLVERAALDADTITDATVLRNLEAIVEGTETATQAAEEAEDAADRAEAAAQTLVIDSTLTQTGQAADAKATGDALAEIVPGLSETAKAALLACFRHVALWTDDGQTYISALENALYPSNFPKIIATLDSTYTPIIGDAVGTLKTHMTVTYYANETSPGETVPSNNYTLTGNLDNPQNQIIVTYNACTYSLIVETIDIYNKYSWSYPDNNLMASVLGVGSSNGDLASGNDRRTLYVTHGRENAQLRMTAGQAINNGNAYMFPVPNGATKATVAITPSTWQVAFTVWDYSNGRDSRVNKKGNGGWISGTSTITFTAGENLGLDVSYRNANASSIVSSDATNITITFE